MRASALLVVVAACACACASGPAPRTSPSPGTPVAVAAASSAPIVLAIVGTNDIHGHILPDEDGRGGSALFASYLKAIRAEHPVVLVDAGDDFQGTLESNLNEGAVVVQVANALGYDAMAIGNHEFDYGPVGPKVIARDPGDDPRGALKARAAEAHYPVLAANIIDEATHQPIAWTNVKPSVMIERAGVKVGIIGVATVETPSTTMASNFAGLAIAPLAPAIDEQAALLRAQGATVVVVAAHAGGVCDLKEDPPTCDDGEIFKVAAALKPGAVDVIIAGHTHAGVRRVVNGITIVEAFAYNRAFSRVDVTIDPQKGVVDKKPSIVEIAPGVVKPDADIVRLMAPAVEAARSRKEEKLGVKLLTKITKVYDVESPLGNLFADLMRSARKADVAVTNGGGLRTDLEAGDLTYGNLYEAYPFDNRFATLHLSGARLAEWIKDNLMRGKGILSISGVRARAACQNGELQVELTRENGKKVKDDEVLTVVTSDFLVGGNEGAFSGLTPSDVQIDDGSLIREEIAAELRHRGGELRNDDKAIFDPEHRRLEYTGKRPLRCK